MNWLVYSVLALMLPTHEGSTLQSLHVMNNNMLFYTTRGKLHYIMELESGSFFQGVGIIDSTRFFLAYDPGTSAEAGTKLVIYNWRTNTTSLIQEIGGTGESHFSYNQQTRMLAFNLHEGIYVLDINRYLHATQTKDIPYEPILVVAAKQCYYAQWVDANTIGYMVIRSKNDKQIKYVRIDNN